MTEVKLKVVNDGCANPRLSVIFMHGLGGDPVETWCFRGSEDGDNFWPRWLAEDMPGLAVYSAGYPADKMGWNEGWPIEEAAVAVLDRLMNNPSIRSTETPIVFVCHSLGGIVVKQLILKAERGRDLDPAKGSLLDRVAGVVFLATPHDGSMLATLACQFGWLVTDATRDLIANSTKLGELSDNYRDYVEANDGRIRHLIYYEKKGVVGVKVVPAGTANPGLAGAARVPIGRDHISLCKLPDRADQVYEGVMAFLDRALQPRPPTPSEKIDNILKIISQRESVPLEALRAILLSMDEAAETLNAAEIEQKLAAKASEFRDLKDRLNQLSNGDPVVTRLRHDASAALDSGLFAKADQFLAEAEHRDLTGLDDLETLALQKRLSAADSRSQRAAALMLQGAPSAYRQAAEHYAEAARIVMVVDLSKAHSYLRLQGDALVTMGKEFGDKSALSEAIRIFQSLLDVIDANHDPFDWAKTQNCLGIAFASMGERERGTENDEKAVAAFHDALKVYTHERAPLNWAVVQHNLGLSLISIGDCMMWDGLLTVNGPEIGMTKYKEGLAAFREALKECTRERDPLRWAMIKNGLGLGLWKSGLRESGTEKLEEAIAVFRDALEVYTRERDPINWGRVHINLGFALTALGKRECGAEKLVEAVAAFRDGLHECSRERDPVDWAKAWTGIGSALSSLSEHESGTQRLEEAVAAFREVLKESSHKNDPIGWAAAQDKLGMALLALGEREHVVAHLEEAVAAFLAALEESPLKRAPVDWLHLQINLHRANALLWGRRIKNGWEKFKNY